MYSFSHSRKLFSWPWLSLFRYYALEVTYFKSSLDRKLLELLWNKYWVNTLSSSSLLTVCESPQKIKMFANCLTFWFMVNYYSITHSDMWSTCCDVLINCCFLAGPACLLVLVISSLWTLEQMKIGIKVGLDSADPQAPHSPPIKRRSFWSPSCEFALRSHFFCPELG